MGEGFFSRGFRGRRRSQDTALPPRTVPGGRLPGTLRRTYAPHPS
jgi:hypothetical protein